MKAAKLLVALIVVTLGMESCVDMNVYTAKDRAGIEHRFFGHRKAGEVFQDGHYGTSYTVVPE